MSDKKALVLLVHGSRDPDWMRPFEDLRGDVESASGVPVRLACLQFCSPSLSESVCGLAEDGIGNVLVVPVFISALGHVLKDVPKEVDDARSKYPDINIDILPALGEMPDVQNAFRDSLMRVAEEM